MVYIITSGVRGAQQGLPDHDFGAKRRCWRAGVGGMTGDGHQSESNGAVLVLSWGPKGPRRPLGLYPSLDGRWVLLLTSNGHVSGSHSSTLVSGIWTIYHHPQHGICRMGASQDPSSHPIHEGKYQQPPGQFTVRIFITDAW